jgi:putative tryptophan/tyrosine transport system substrate-binding protein
MKRREFITLVGGAAAWPLAARAQQPTRMRRIGVIILYPENDPQGQLRATAFRSELEKAGWTIGGNLQIDFEWGTGDADWVRFTTEHALRKTPDVCWQTETPRSWRHTG